jgi:hypothetical protein
MRNHRPTPKLMRVQSQPSFSRPIAVLEAFRGHRKAWIEEGEGQKRGQKAAEKAVAENELDDEVEH